MAAHDSSHQLPTADAVVAKMMERDNQREAALHGYTALRRYVLENQRRHKRAEMLVRMKCLDDGSKQFETVSATGWGGVRKHVFPRLLESESEASRPGIRERSRITPENYSFEMAGTDNVNERPAYVLAITPKTQNKCLMEGRIWVDAADYAIVRIGQARQKPVLLDQERSFYPHLPKKRLLVVTGVRPFSDRRADLWCDRSQHRIL